jgi:NAD-dependent dihydropyrimidine dehydrogenase PreA subunit
VNATNARRSRVVLRPGSGAGEDADRSMSATDRATLTRLLLERGLEVSCSQDALPEIEPAPSGGATILVGHFGGTASPSPVPPPPGTRFFDVVRTADGERIEPAALVAAIERGAVSDAADSPLPASGPAVGKPATWKPWFPVIDYSRCTNCMQCLSFCLFDVYGVSSESKIQVQHQSNCKTDCPACSRVCPEVAIMFPKYRHGPINGEEVKADDIRREAMKVDISALLGGDVYAMLRDRSVKAKSRFSKERDDDRALKERQNCLIALQRDLEIPAEVFAALPSPQEILAKAEAARVRAQGAVQAATLASAAPGVAPSDPSAPEPQPPAPSPQREIS